MEDRKSPDQYAVGCPHQLTNGRETDRSTSGETDKEKSAESPGALPGDSHSFPLNPSGPFRMKGPSNRFLSTYRYMKDPFGWYDRWHKKFGDTFQIRALNGDVVVTCNPENVRRIFAAPEPTIAPFAADTARPLLGGRSVFLADGEVHRRERSLLLPSFHGELIEETVDTIQQVALTHSRHWESGQTVKVMDNALDLSLEVILRVVFGLQSDDKVEVFKSVIQKFVGSFHPVLAFSKILQRPLFGLSPWNRFVRARTDFDRLIFEEIKGRRSQDSVSGNDLLSRLLIAKYDDGSKVTDDGIRDQLVSLLLAGHETTQIAIGWAMSWLARYPDVQQDLRDEIRRDGVQEVVASSVLMTGICNESLRLNPVLPDVVRKLLKPIELEECIVPAGKSIGAITYLSHLDPTRFPDPRKFDPARWKNLKLRPHEYYPFGGGVRRCIGATLAMIEMKIVIATWIDLARFQTPTGAPEVEPVHRRNLTMAPQSGIPLIVQRDRK